MGVEFKDNSAAVKAQMEKNIAKALVAIGLHWQQRATELATDNSVVDTGRFRASLSYITPDKESGLNKPVSESKLEDALSGTAPKDMVIVGSNVEYAPYLESGTARMSPRPTVGSAVLYYKDEYQEIAKETLKEGF